MILNPGVDPVFHGAVDLLVELLDLLVELLLFLRSQHLLVELLELLVEPHLLRRGEPDLLFAEPLDLPVN